MKFYTCENCKHEWEFFPKDYKYNKKHYPKICPLCKMSILQTYRDIRIVEGVWESIKFVIKYKIFKK